MGILITPSLDKRSFLHIPLEVEKCLVNKEKKSTKDVPGKLVDLSGALDIGFGLASFAFSLNLFWQNTTVRM